VKPKGPGADAPETDEYALHVLMRRARSGGSRVLPTHLALTAWRKRTYPISAALFVSSTLTHATTSPNGRP
jgi:hypothetical protein